MTRLSITITKGVTADALVIRRAGGSTVEFHFPKKGSIPHDVTHLFVEETLGMTRGFWGMVADGDDPAAIADIAKRGGHASAKRAQIPDPAIVEILQAERIVECFEADLWGPPTDFETFRGVVNAACAASHAPTPALSDEVIAAVRASLREFAKEWSAAPRGATFEFRFPSAR